MSCVRLRDKHKAHGSWPYTYVDFARGVYRSPMVRSTIIVRASDALPLAASVDDEQVCPLLFASMYNIIWGHRQNRHSRSISNNLNLFSDALRPTRNLVVP
jgi:hypothetical protein